MSSLNLYRNNIGAAGAQHRAAAIGEMSSLTSLNLGLDLNNIGDAGAQSQFSCFVHKITTTRICRSPNRVH